MMSQFPILWTIKDLWSQVQYSNLLQLVSTEMQIDFNETMQLQQSFSFGDGRELFNTALKYS